MVKASKQERGAEKEKEVQREKKYWQHQPEEMS